MAQQPETRVTISEWRGLRTNASPHTVDEQESTRQENCASVAQGRLDVRQGLKAVTWDN